jgi:hypothetical protein
MNDSTNNSFEEQWQKAFNDASLPPSDMVWEKIKLSLGNENVPPTSRYGSYYIGSISVLILGIVLWFFMGKREETVQKQVIANKTILLESKTEKFISKTEEEFIIKPKEKTPVLKVFTPKKEEVIEPIIEPETITQIPENQEQIITDSINFMIPIVTPKKVDSELINKSMNIPFEQTPYYEISKPKPKKKSVWDKVRISGGVGIYQ